MKSKMDDMDTSDSDDVQRLRSRLVSEAPLTWVVPGQPVVALMTTSETDAQKPCQSVGQPSLRNCVGETLFLWIALNQDTSELFIALSVRVALTKARSTRTRPRKSPSRTLFLVIPPESLALEVNHVAYTSDAIPSQFRQSPSDTESGKCSIMHMSFDLGDSKSSVIMPAYDMPKSPIMPSSLALLREIKSLSEVSRFSLYANADHVMNRSLEQVRNMLEKSHPVTAPSVHLDRLYPGNRSACVDNWNKQGWFLEKSALVSKTDIDQAPDPFKQPLPLYEDANQPSLSTTSAPAPSLPSTAPPAYDEDHSPPISAASPSIAHACLDSHLLHDIEAPLAGFAPSPASSYHPLFRSPTPRPPPTPSPLLSSDYTADLVATSPSDTVASAILDTTNRALSEEAHNGGKIAASERSAQILDPVRRKRPSSAAHQATHPKSMRVFRTPASAQDLPGPPSRFASTMSTTQPDTPSRPIVSSPHNTAVAESTLGSNDTVYAPDETCVTLWLKEAWKVCPGAHFVCIIELLSLASVASKHDEESNSRCWAACTAALVRYCAEEDLARTRDLLQTQPDPVEDDIDFDEMAALTTWLCVLRRGADMEFFASLLELSALTQRHTRPWFHEAVEPDLVTQYTHQKAKLIDHACTGLYQDILEQGEDAIFLAMMREKKRLGI
ncbi:hypothetical protein AAFC00_002385 [Neodothiora populina]|uniref:Uncharacterized protein n=1 Tax=Neodothiora populina TaxID=2781224 RepID=A0ABR3PH98_9PEZI